MRDLIGILHALTVFISPEFYMLSKKTAIALFISLTCLVPKHSYTEEPTYTQIVATQVLLLAVTKGLEWLTKEEHSCPPIQLPHNHVFIIDYFKALTNASNSYVANLKLLHSFEPENKDVPLLLVQALHLQKKFAQKLEEVEKLSDKQQIAYQLTQEYKFTVEDLKILAQLKARGYKDVPLAMQWESKKDEFIEVSHGIYFAKKLLIQTH